MNKIGISSCLVGICCRYNNEKLKLDLRAKLKDYELILFCPELLGGLSCPRSPAEIKGGDGFDVLMGKAKVITSEGRDVSQNFIVGALKSLEYLKQQHVKKVILKSNSPSCSNAMIYDGTFSTTKVVGVGVTCACLLLNDFIVINETEL